MKKPSVLLISGWAHGAEAMHPLAEAMAESHCVTSLSLAGPGAPPRINAGGRRPGGIKEKGEDPNGPKDGAASVSPYARAIAHHLDKAGEPACVVGWSTGGIAAIEAAANYPEKVCGLVLLSATARFCSDAGYSAGVAPAVLRAMIRSLARRPEAVIADFLEQALYPVRIPADELARRTANALKQGTNCLIDGLEYLARVDLRDVLPAVTAPCLIIHGRQDRIVPRQAAKFLASKLPASEVELLPSAGHSLIEQSGKDLINRILQFQELLR
ncbi:MAG: alpha/beta fold hydrolase [Syntrophobacteraceae bacterium]